jgi:hypothetical protein
VLGVGDGVADDALEEGLKDTAGLLVDHCRDTLDTATTSETANSGLGNALDVVAQNLAMTLGATLAKALSTFAAWRETASVSTIHLYIKERTCNVARCDPTLCPRLDGAIVRA